MGGIGSGKSPAMRDYWARMTPEQRSAEMQRRMRIGKRRKNREIASSESPFPNVAPAKHESQHRTLRNLVSDLESAIEELKTMFEF
jgi:hypothetical protein